MFYSDFTSNTENLNFQKLKNVFGLWWNVAKLKSNCELVDNPILEWSFWKRLHYIHHCNAYISEVVE